MTPPFTVYVKISSENLVSGAWFYNFEDAQAKAKHWECIVPVMIDLDANDVATHQPK